MSTRPKDKWDFGCDPACRREHHPPQIRFRREAHGSINIQEGQGDFMPKTMRAARMHSVGTPMTIDTIPVPKTGSTDVLVEVKACGMVPNLGNVLANWTKWFPHLPLPKLPAVFGLDPAGVVVEVGEQVLDVRPGDRVYVNPLRSCGACQMCRAGERTRCRYFTFNGYFGFGPDSQKIYDLYPYGGFCEYMTAPQYALVKLPDNVTFEQAARFGY